MLSPVFYVAWCQKDWTMCTKIHRIRKVYFNTWSSWKVVWLLFQPERMGMTATTEQKKERDRESYWEGEGGREGKWWKANTQHFFRKLHFDFFPNGTKEKLTNVYIYVSIVQTYKVYFLFIIQWGWKNLPNRLVCDAKCYSL